MKCALHLMLASAALLFISACDGPSGPPGPPGNANVVSFTFPFDLDDATINGELASIQLDVEAITPSVVDGGAVLMFFYEQQTWTAMPFTYGVESADPELDAVDYTVTLGFGYEVGFLEVFYEASVAGVVDQLPDRDVKVVIIDGFALSKSGIDLSNWEEVRDYFGLED